MSTLSPNVKVYLTIETPPLKVLTLDISVIWLVLLARTTKKLGVKTLADIQEKKIIRLLAKAIDVSQVA